MTDHICFIDDTVCDRCSTTYTQLLEKREIVMTRNLNIMNPDDFELFKELTKDRPKHNYMTQEDFEVMMKSHMEEFSGRLKDGTI